MNKIEIRAWDPKRKVMEPSVGFSDSDCGRFWQRELYMVDDQSNFGSFDWIPMQSTGLKDKNGKKIYEGDVINDSGIKTEVYWNEKDGCWARRGISEHYFGLTASICEIIGNVYENPELLKQPYAH